MLHAPTWNIGTAKSYLVMAMALFGMGRVGARVLLLVLTLGTHALTFVRARDHSNGARIDERPLQVPDERADGDVLHGAVAELDADLARGHPLGAGTGREGDVFDVGASDEMAAGR